MTSNRNGNVLEAGEKDAPIKINCREDPSKNICKNETVTHEIIVAKSSRIAWEETSKNTIVPIAQQPSAPQTSRNTKTNQGLTDSDSLAYSALSQSKKQSEGNTEIKDKDSAIDQKESDVSELFQARIKADNKKRQSEMVFVDQMDMRDPQMNAENAASIFFNLLKQEKELGIKADYLTTVQLKSEVKDTSRAFLVEWIIDVHRKFRLMPESLYLTMLIVDRYLSLV